MGSYLSNDDFSCFLSKRSNRPLEFNSSTFEKLNEMEWKWLSLKQPECSFLSDVFAAVIVMIV